VVGGAPGEAGGRQVRTNPGVRTRGPAAGPRPTARTKSGIVHRMSSRGASAFHRATRRSPHPASADVAPVWVAIDASDVPARHRAGPSPGAPIPGWGGSAL